MQAQSIPPLLAGSIAFVPGAFAVYLYARCRRREDLTFALTCVAITAYDISTGISYNAVSPEQGVFWQHWQLTTLAIVAIAMLQYVSDCLGGISTRFRFAVTSYFGVLGLIEACGDFGLLFQTDHPFTHVVHLPWGGEVVYREMLASPFFLVHSGIGLIAFAFAFLHAYRAYEKGERRFAPALMASLSLFALSETNDACVSAGVYSFLYTLEYCWLGMVLIGFYVLMDEVVEAGIVKAERQTLEEQLRQAAKMEAIGRLAGGVAHDLNNQLTPIIGYSDVALLREELNDNVREYFGHIRDAAEHARELTQQLLAFGRKQILKLAVIDLNEVVGASKKMIARMVPENIQIRFRLDTELGRVRGDATQLRQILFNLILNARDAMPNGGQLEISTTHRELDLPAVEGMGGAQPGRYVVLSVRDTGIGMEPAMQSKIFEPFFTTKDLSTNSGLGLPSVYGIVKQHAGGIHVESAVGCGSLFEVCLPAVDAPATPSPTPGSGMAKRRTGATLLLVEDEDSVRKLASSVLTEEGFVVLEASTPTRAMDRAFSHAGTIHLLVTDVVMPEMTGVELYERLRARLPNLPVLYTSGYTQSLAAPDSGANRTAFLPKPFSPSELLKAVGDALDS